MTQKQNVVLRFFTRTPVMLCMSAAILGIVIALSMLRLSGYFQPHMPHSHCYLRDPILTFGMAATSVGIWLAYMAISIALFKVRAIMSSSIGETLLTMLALFGIFVNMCGWTHFMKTVSLFWPWYYAELFVEAITALVSIYTAFYFTPKIKTFLNMTIAISSARSAIDALSVNPSDELTEVLERIKRISVDLDKYDLVRMGRK